MLPILQLVAAAAPTVLGLFTADKGSNAEKAIGVATGIAEALTGRKGDEAINMVNASPEMQLEFKRMLLADAHIDEQMRYADRADARSMYKHHHEMQDKIADKVMTYNLWIVGGLVAANVAMVVFTPTEYMAEVAGASTLIGIVINALLKERQDVVGFSFGSSMGSKMKDVK